MNVETSKRSEEYKKKNQPKMKGGNTSVKTVNGKKTQLVWTNKNYGLFPLVPRHAGGNETFPAAQRVLTVLC